MATTTDAKRGEAYKLWIGGEAVEGGDGTYEVVNPATEEVVGLAPEASEDDARAAAEAAARAFPAWSQTTPAERAALLNKAADLVGKYAGEIGGLAQQETGQLAAMAEAMNVGVAIGRLRRYAAGAMEPMDIGIPPVPNYGGPGGAGGIIGAVVKRQPVGVVAGITSYNVPLANVMGKLAPALAMGNTFVVKPAPQDPLAVIRLVEVMHEAGFPPGVINVVVGSTPASSEALVASPDVDMVSFTGSTSVGIRIGESAAKGMKRTLMELGGKGASLVFDSADAAAAAAGTASTFAFHAGQICTAPTRLIAQRGIYDEVVSKLAEIARVLKVGDPTAPDTVVGPVITGTHRDRVESYIRAGKSEGGTILTGGQRPAFDKGFYVQPTLIADCTNEMKVAQEEIFGPVVVAIPFDDEEEGIEIANDSDFGLYDYVWSGDTIQALRVAQRLRCGSVGLNTVNRNMEAAFGGFKMSGIGRDTGSFAMHAYTELQSIVWQA